MQKMIPIELGERSYSIWIGTGLLESLGEQLRRLQVDSASNLLVITDDTVSSHGYLKSVLDSLQKSGYQAGSAIVPAGESSKSLEQAGMLYERCLEFGLDRNSTILALGGGVIGDLAGFVAATYMRGIDFIGLPTTLLAHDSSVGGKVAVNLPAGKNLVGCFYQPKAVLYDVSVLQTLSLRERKSGLAEVAKHAFLSSESYVSFLQNNADELLNCERDAITEALYRGIQVKAAIVSADERESGVRAHLNLGHTLGHAIEAVTKYQRYTHGEAISIGMSFAFELAVQMGICSSEIERRAIGLLRQFGLPTQLPSDLETDSLLDKMFEDKKTVGKQLAFVLPVAFGRVETIKPMSLDLVRQRLDAREEWGD